MHMTGPAMGKKNPAARAPFIYGCGFRVSDVRCPESRSVRFSEVALVLKLYIVISIRATDFVRCRQVVLLSDGDGPLWEVRLYDR